MQARVPDSLHYQGRYYRRTGQPNPNGAVLFLSPSTGQAFEARLGRIANTGPHYFLVETEGGGRQVRVENYQLQGGVPLLGTVVLLGPVVTSPLWRSADAAWRIEVVSGPRVRGMISEVSFAGTSGRILAEGGQSVHVHRSQLTRGAVLARGRSVTFVRGDVGRGPTAFDVRPA